MLEKDSDSPPSNSFPAINVRERKRHSNSRKLALVYLSFYTPNFLIPISSRYGSSILRAVTEWDYLIPIYTEFTLKVSLNFLFVLDGSYAILFLYMF